jgi:malate dehydrogenase
MNSKITIIGAGNVGATTAKRLLEKKIGDIVLLDIVNGLPQGKSLDLIHSAAICGYDKKIIGTNSYEDTKDSDIIVITSGSPRKEGMSREDLLKINSEIVKSVTEKAVKESPQAVIVMVTNPLDVMVWVAYKVSKFSKERVIGMSSNLDTGRFKSLIAQELNISPEKIEALVIGQHSNSMIPLPQHSKVNGKPLLEVMNSEKIKEIIEKTRNSGAEVIKLMGTSAFYAPSAAITRIVEAILKDEKKIIPCSVYCDGEYGLKDVFIGLPARLGKRGIEEIIELELTEEQEEQLKGSAKSIKKFYKEAEEFI